MLIYASPYAMITFQCSSLIMLIDILELASFHRYRDLGIDNTEVKHSQVLFYGELHTTSGIS